MFNRAVNAFKNSIIKSKSSTTLTNPEQDVDDNTCNESMVSSFSSATISSCPTSTHDKHRRSSVNSTPTTRISLLRRQRRSHSSNREGENLFSFFLSFLPKKTSWHEKPKSGWLTSTSICKKKKKNFSAVSRFYGRCDFMALREIRNGNFPNERLSHAAIKLQKYK